MPECQTCGNIDIPGECKECGDSIRPLPEPEGIINWDKAGDIFSGKTQSLFSNNWHCLHFSGKILTCTLCG
jgi:recombinational DNA repair protein RecR